MKARRGFVFVELPKHGTVVRLAMRGIIIIVDALCCSAWISCSEMVVARDGDSGADVTAMARVARRGVVRRGAS